MNHEASQMPNSAATTHVYLLQVDPSISLVSSDQDLSLLDNNLENHLNQNESVVRADALSISMKLKEEQDHVQILNDSCHNSKILGILVSETCQNVHNQHKSHIESQMSSKQDKNVSAEVSNSIPYSIQDYVHIYDRTVPPRALAVLPNILKVQRRDIISARRTLPARARFGPVQGVRSNKLSPSEAVGLVLNATSNKKALFLVRDDKDLIIHIDVSDKDKSNWISLLPLGTQDSANVWLYEENQELYAITTEIIPSRKPLMLGYSKMYADTYGLVGPTKDIEKVSLLQKPWWCHECQRTMPTANLLRCHTNMYHKEGKQVYRRKYRCKHCSSTFSTIFTLRRHANLHCKNKNAKRNNVVITETEAEAQPQINLNLSICHEDNRISSDESFQNYTNGLDFSTNLFDTDRIPNLDISGNSRSDNDFNPYAIGFRDENGLTNEFGASIKTDSRKSTEEKKTKPVDQFLVTCTYCNQIVVKEKRRLHLRECPGRRFECVCKKVFTSKEKLAQHVFEYHSNKPENDRDDSKASTNPKVPTSTFKCENCQVTFKRRGMLVNHLWRVHKTVSTKVPLERRERYYPCVACPKIYRAAAKRDRHVLLHHPGSEDVRGQALDGGTRPCEPAACPACPRQYATRAKLLQHQRRDHPYLAPPRICKK